MLNKTRITLFLLVSILISGIVLSWMSVMQYSGIFLLSLLMLPLIVWQLLKSFNTKSIIISPNEGLIILFTSAYGLRLMAEPAVDGIYQFTSLVLAVLIYYQLRLWRYYASLSYRHIYIVLVAYGLIQALFVIGQWLGVVPAVDKLFHVSGTLANPNATAISLVLPLWCIGPLFFKDDKFQSKVIGVGLIAVLVLVLILLKCRAAYLGLLVSGLFFIYVAYKSFVTKHVKKVVFITLGFILAGVCIYGLYHLKKDSTNGRVLLWKNSAVVITDNLYWGVGPGMFKKAYATTQAEYFKSHPEVSDYQKKRAKVLLNPLNEYLRLTIEFGILIGGLLCIGFLLTVVRISNTRYLEIKCALIAIAVISMFNFSVYIPTVQLQVAIVLAFLPPMSKRQVKLNWPLVYAGKVAAALFLGLFVLFNGVYWTKSKEFKSRYYAGEYEQAINLFENRLNMLSLFDRYNLMAGKFLWQNGQYEKALSVFNTQLERSGDYKLMIAKAKVLIDLNQLEEAEGELLKTHYMLPAYLTPRVELVNFYIRTGRVEEALQLANESIKMGPIVDNNRSKELLSRLERIIARYN